jgi:hypothetical protein
MNRLLAGQDSTRLFEPVPSRTRQHRLKMAIRARVQTSSSTFAAGRPSAHALVALQHSSEVAIRLGEGPVAGVLFYVTKLK